ncbi:MAG: hypothetical protein OXF75_06950 [Acidimicrobiaceae bacterium]|nr:hypothetical protein [Acidimicrobiaceae bacterium]
MTDERGVELKPGQRFWLSRATLQLTRRLAAFHGFFAAYFFYLDRLISSVVLLIATFALAGMSFVSWIKRREVS